MVLREEVMNDVIIDDVVEQMAADKTKVAVDRGQGALNEGPALGLKVRDIRVGVVEIGDGNCRAVSSCRRIGR